MLTSLFSLLLPLLPITSCAQAGDSPHFSCGPFLLQPRPTAMTVVVDHEAEVSARMRYWIKEGGDEHVLEHQEPARHHVFSLEGLAPGTVYSYEITSALLNSGVHEFRTLPIAPRSYRVLAMGDVRSQPEVWGRVSDRMFEHEPDALFAIGTGDYPADGRKYSGWIREFFTPARSFLGHMPLWPAIGNHEYTRRHDDVTDIEDSHYFSLFELPGNERWYRVDYQFMTLLVIDSNSHMTPGDVQYEWLRTELRSPRNRFTLVAFHHAPLTSGPHARMHPDGTPAEWPVDEGRRFLVPLFEMYNVDLVLTGHDHLYERSEKDGVVYVVTGGGGAPLYKVDSVPNPYQVEAVSTYHYVALDIDQSGIEISAIDENGELFDNELIPATDEHIERRTHSAKSMLAYAVDFGPIDPATHMTRVTLHNPFDHALDVKIKTVKKGYSAKTLHETIPARGRREVSWKIKDVEMDFESEPWREAIALDLKLDFEGRDQALDIDVNLKQRATLYRPIVATPRLESPVTDGNLQEWTDVPALLVDERTPIVKKPASYDPRGDFRAELRLAWSEGMLHLSVDISDDKITDDVAAKIDESDCVRVLFNIPHGPSQGMAICSFGPKGRFESNLDTTLIQYQSRQRYDRWILEVGIPFEALGLTRDAVANELTCDFLFIDRDEEMEVAKPSVHRMWTKSRSRRDTSTFGTLLLQD